MRSDAGPDDRPAAPVPHRPHVASPDPICHFAFTVSAASVFKTRVDASRLKLPPCEATRVIRLRMMSSGCRSPPSGNPGRNRLAKPHLHRIGGAQLTVVAATDDQGVEPSAGFGLRKSRRETRIQALGRSHLGVSDDYPGEQPEHGGHVRDREVDSHNRAHHDDRDADPARCDCGVAGSAPECAHRRRARRPERDQTRNSADEEQVQILVMEEQLGFTS